MSRKNWKTSWLLEIENCLGQKDFGTKFVKVSKVDRTYLSISARRESTNKASRVPIQYKRPWAIVRIMDRIDSPTLVAAIGADRDHGEEIQG